MSKKPTRTYEEICRDVAEHYHTPKELRKIHKELKYYGDGMALHMRYPYLPIWMAVLALIMQILALIAL